MIDTTMLRLRAALAVPFATLGFAVGRLSSTWRHSRLIVATVGASAVAFLFEITYIAVQAARQEASHFNESAPFSVPSGWRRPSMPSSRPSSSTRLSGAIP